VSGEAPRDRDAIYAALGAGRCYLAIDSIAPARGFSFAAAGAAPVEMGSEGPLELVAQEGVVGAEAADLGAGCFEPLVQ